MLLLGAAARHGARTTTPFFCGVVLGMQMVVWPVGFGLLQLASYAPAAYQALRWCSAIYTLWLAWQIAGARIDTGTSSTQASGFGRGLLVQPFNPKAWTIATGTFTQFVPHGTAPVLSTAAVALATLVVGVTLQGLWFWGGSEIVRLPAAAAHHG